jgi:hypothetical protein
MSKPELDAEVNQYFRALTILDRTRVNNGYSDLPIQVSEMLAYCELFGIEDLDDREVFVEMILAGDAEILSHRYSRQKSRVQSKQHRVPSIKKG